VTALSGGIRRLRVSTRPDRVAAATIAATWRVARKPYVSRCGFMMLTKSTSMRRRRVQ
jgi:hypothetical protein